MNTIEYSILHVDGEWKLIVDREIRGVFPNKEAAMSAALAAADAARKMGRRAVVGSPRQRRPKEKVV
jgi:hypothetical protein